MVHHLARSETVSSVSPSEKLQNVSLAQKSNVMSYDIEHEGLATVAEDAVVSEEAARGSADEAYRIAGEIAMEYTAEEEKSVRRKIDRRIPLFCAAIYFLQFLDKNLLNYR